MNGVVWERMLLTGCNQIVLLFQTLKKTYEHMNILLESKKALEGSMQMSVPNTCFIGFM